MQALTLQYYHTPIDIGPRNSRMMHLNNQMYMYIYLHRGLFFLAGWAENPITI